MSFLVGDSLPNIPHLPSRSMLSWVQIKTNFQSHLRREKGDINRSDRKEITVEKSGAAALRARWPRAAPASVGSGPQQPHSQEMATPSTTVATTSSQCPQTPSSRKTSSVSKCIFSLKVTNSTLFVNLVFLMHIF